MKDKTEEKSKKIKDKIWKIYKTDKKEKDCINW